MERVKNHTVTTTDTSKCLARLVLFPLPLQGHINPMFQLAHILHSRGFHITIIHTQFNSPNPSNYPQFSFVSIQDGLLQDETSTEDVVSLLTILNARCVEPFTNCLAELLSSSSDSIACLISDPIWHFTQAVADGLKLPRIVIRTSNVCSFLAYANFPLLREKGYLHHINQGLSDLQPEEDLPMLPPLKVRDLPIIETRNHEIFYQLIVTAVDQIRASSGIILNTFEELESVSLATLRQDFPHMPVFAIGPFHKYFGSSFNSLLAQDQNCVSWLDHQAPGSVLYVSFGSVEMISQSEFQEIAWGIANSNQPFLWVVRPGLVCGSDWLEGLPDGFMEIVNGRGRIVKWAPQQEVLAHPATGGFWTHNGWNSTLESICEGVPMICHPIAGDQIVNARYVSDVWRIGLHLEKTVERKEIENVIRRLMVEPEGEELRKKVMYLKEKAEFCLQQGGSSSLSLEKLTSYIISF
ncbi:UDP-glycosyltransferase 76B1 [Linum grandiflorum]